MILKKKKTKSIQGKYKEVGFWHYGVSLKIILTPFVGASLKSHLVFTNDGKTIIDDTKKQHSYRRNKGARFFNAEWRDMLLAFIKGLTDTQGFIKLQVTKDEGLVEFSECTKMHRSTVSYNEPCTPMDEEKIIDSYTADFDEDENAI